MTTTYDELQNKIKEAENTLASLEAERKELPEKLAKAIAAADAKAITAVQRRLEKVDGEIIAAKVNLLRAKLELARARHTEAVNARKALRDEIMPLLDKRAALEQQIAKLQAKLGNANSDMSYYNRRIGELERELAQLTAGAPQGPVVRSWWQVKV